MTSRRWQDPHDAQNAKGALAAVSRARHRAVIQAIVVNLRRGMAADAARRDGVRRVYPHLRSDDGRDRMAQRVFAQPHAVDALRDLGVDDATIALVHVRTDGGEKDRTPLERKNDAQLVDPGTPSFSHAKGAALRRRGDTERVR